jgi:hypothetical protein
MRVRGPIAGDVALALCASACASVLGLDGYHDVTDGGAIGEGDGPSAADANGAPAEADLADAPGAADSITCGADAASCFVVPVGWELVAFTNSAQTACPPGFSTGVDLVAGSPQPAADACTCDSCSVTTSPSCVTGPVSFAIDTTSLKTCGVPGGMLLNQTAGGCNTDNFHGAILTTYDIKISPLAPTGGACAAGSPTPHPDRVSFAQLGRACLRDMSTAAGCVGGACAPAIAPPFALCLSRTGSADCPPGPFGVASHVGTGASLTCTDTCACAVNATCSDAMVTYYSDTACMNAPTLPVSANGTCVNQGGSGLAYGSYRYTAMVSATCSGTGTGPASVGLAGERTLCCMQ